MAETTVHPIHLFVSTQKLAIFVAVSLATFLMEPINVFQFVVMDALTECVLLPMFVTVLLALLAQLALKTVAATAIVNVPFRVFVTSVWTTQLDSFVRRALRVTTKPATLALVATVDATSTATFVEE